MIITCEQCNARYLLASLLLGVSGRTVRCGVCGHSWYQEPADEPFSRESADTASFADMVQNEMDPIPEGVRPIPEGSGIPAIHTDIKNPISKKGVAGALAALLVFVLLSGLIVIRREPIARTWPPSALLYEMAGLPISVPGEGLVFDQVKAVATPDAEGHYTLTVTGNVLNLRKQDAVLPKIQAALVQDGAMAPDGWAVNVDAHKIKGEETIPFTATYDNLPDAIAEVNVRFVLN